MGTKGRQHRSGWAIFGFILAFIVLLGLGQFVYQTYQFYSIRKAGQSAGVFMPIAEPTAEMKMQNLLAQKERDRFRQLVKGKAGDPFTGPADAKYEIVIFEDFFCPYCKMAQQTIAELMKLRPDVKISFRDFPITELHPDSMIASQAARCVWQQGDAGKYLRYHELLYSNQNNLDRSVMEQQAYGIGADRTAFGLCMQEQNVVIAINKSIMEAESADVTATPTFFIDGIKVEGVHEASKLLELLK